MRFSSEIHQYVKGQKFSTALEAAYDGENTNASDRLGFLVGRAKGKRILHIGFTDHLEVIEHKIKYRLWLHALLMENAARCVGVDTNREAVEFCRSKLKIGDVFTHDIVNDAPLSEILEGEWDYAVLGEVLEHVPNPVTFLSSIRERYGKTIQRAIVTVPNAWMIDNLLMAIRGREAINSDHRYWFTPYTLGKVANDAGYRIEEFHFVNPPFPDKMITRALKRRYPALRETLIGVLAPCSGS
jgi:hypothetical protein